MKFQGWNVFLGKRRKVIGLVRMDGVAQRVSRSLVVGVVSLLALPIAAAENPNLTAGAAANASSERATYLAAQAIDGVVDDRSRWLASEADMV